MELDFATIAAIPIHGLTLGKIAGHHLSVNNLQGIVYIFTEISGENLWNALREYGDGDYSDRITEPR
jgi:hypothetical protein